ncbi:MAG TPA: hypothetical protein VFK32_02755 [Tepidiformaceae bacterium]|nr:hypothetical protein [Tepidiformaceae bacterium]
MREIRILALGGSNVVGYGLEDPATSWAMLVGGAIETAHGHPVSVTSALFFLEPTDSAPFIARLIAEHHPDVVLLNCAPAGFAIKTVANSVGRLAGKRVRRALVVGEMRLQGAIGSLGDRNVPVRRFLKRGVRKATGARTRMSVGDAIMSGKRAIKTFAAAEDVGTVVRCPLEAASWVKEEQGPEHVESYLFYREEMGKAARAARMTYVENTFDHTPEEERRVFMPDGVHLSAEGHKAVAPLWLPAALAECERRH